MDIRTAGVDELKSMKGVGQAKASSIEEWKEAGKIRMVSLVSTMNIPQATWGKWHGEGLLIIPGMAKEEVRVTWKIMSSSGWGRIHCWVQYGGGWCCSLRSRSLMSRVVRTYRRT